MSTPRLHLPYPSPPDPADVPADIQALADSIDIAAVAMQGTLAARPAAGTMGRLYMVQGDTPANNGVAYWDTGAAWVPITPPRPVVAGRLALAAAYSLTTGGWIKLPFDTATFDTAGNFANAAQGRFDITVAGVYQVNASIWLTVASTMALAIYHNGTAYAYSSYINSNAQAININDLVQCTAGDYFELYYLTTVAGALTTGSAYNYMSAALVR